MLIYVDLFQACTDLGMTMWNKMAPESLKRVLETYAELVNSPRIGTYENYMWPSCQLNIAEPQHAGRGKTVCLLIIIGSIYKYNRVERPLGDSNGKFGDHHIDGLDAHTHMSSATVLTDIPKPHGWEPGRMHFTAIGVYITLESLYVY